MCHGRCPWLSRWPKHRHGDLPQRLCLTVPGGAPTVAAGNVARELYQPHDNLFRKVFSDEAEAAGLLRPHLPEWLSTMLDWSTLRLQDRSYVDEETGRQPVRLAVRGAVPS